MELSREAEAPPQDVSQPAAPIEYLKEQLFDLLVVQRGQNTEEVCRNAADAVLQLLIDQGHVIPGAPPAAQILHDAQQFASQLILSKLAARILNMLAFSNLKTPETVPARKWIDDYLEGKNHGPIGRPMLWPGGLPGMAQLLRDWGFIPTIAQPGQPPYVAKAVQTPTVQ